MTMHDIVIVTKEGNRVRTFTTICGPIVPNQGMIEHARQLAAKRAGLDARFCALILTDDNKDFVGDLWTYKDGDWTHVGFKPQPLAYSSAFP